MRSGKSESTGYVFPPVGGVTKYFNKKKKIIIIIWFSYHHKPKHQKHDDTDKYIYIIYFKSKIFSVNQWNIKFLSWLLV